MLKKILLKLVGNKNQKLAGKVIEISALPELRLMFSWVLLLFFYFVLTNLLLKILFGIVFTFIIGSYLYKAYLSNKYLLKMENFIKQVNYINSLTEAMRGAMKLEEVLTLILKNLIDGLNFDRALIYVIKKEHGPVIGYSAGYDKGGEFDYAYDAPIDKEKSILARCIIDQQTYVISDAPNNYYCEQVLVEKLNLKEFGLIPIVIKGKSAGVIFVDNYISKRKIDDNTIQALKVFANQAGIAIENAKIHEKVENLATRDGLTGIFNHRYFQGALRKEIERASRHNRQMSLIFIDIDNFKHYNDRNGHVEGDELLKDISQIFSDNIRETDILARYGGEEFVIILSETNREGSLAAADKILKAVGEHPFNFGANQPLGKVTVSMGVSTYPVDAKEPEVLIDLADKGLYQAKTTGKNKVCFQNC